MQKKIFVLTGEPSGDKLAAKAVSKLKKINNNIGGKNRYFIRYYFLTVYYLFFYFIKLLYNVFIT